MDVNSLCDPHLFTIATCLEGDRVEIERFPKVAGHRRRADELPAVRKVLKARA